MRANLAISAGWIVRPTKGSGNHRFAPFTSIPKNRTKTKSIIEINKNGKAMAEYFEYFAKWHKYARTTPTIKKANCLNRKYSLLAP